MSAGTAKLGTGVPAGAWLPPLVPPLLEQAARNALIAANDDPARNPRRLMCDSAIRWSCACSS